MVGEQMKLYTIHCPKCRVLETKLKQKNIEYEEISDEKKLLELGLSDMPMLELDSGELLTFVEANNYINSLKRNI